MTERAPRFTRWLPRYLWMMALLSLVLTLLPTGALWGLINDIVTWLNPYPLIDLATTLSMALMAAALGRRKRIAMILMLLGTVPLLLIYLSALIEFALDRPDPLTIALVLTNLAIAAVVAGGLILHRRWYSAAVRKGFLRQAALILAVGVAASFALTIVIQGLVFGFSTANLNALFASFFDTGEPAATVPNWLLLLLGLLLSLSIVAAVWALLRSQRAEAALTLDEEATVRRLLHNNPSDSLGYFATRRDKSLLHLDAVAVSYRVYGGICLASGDPLGERRHWERAARAFIDHASFHGWIPAVIAASEEGGAAYHAAGLRVLHFGDEAVVATDRLADFPQIRRSVARLQRLGYTARIRRQGAVGPDELAALGRLAEQWRGDESDRGFSMALGRWGDPADAQTLIVEALFPPEHPSHAGQPAGLLSFVPWGRNGASLDVMRRHPDADNGVTEFMVTHLVTSGGEFGLQQASLNFAVFREAFAEGARIGAGPVARLWRRILLWFSRWWQLESLYRANAKYDPQWRPRMLCYPSARDLPRVASAMAAVEGFWHLPGAATTQPVLTPDEAAPLLAIEPPPPALPTRRLPDEMRHRLLVRDELLADGVEPYAVGFDPTATCADAEGRCRVAGRVVGLRDHGGVIFLDLRDRTGDLQLIVERDRAGTLPALRRAVHAGDLIGVDGTVATSRTGTRSLLADGWVLLAKGLQPLPSRHVGLRDPEARVRLRHLDLILNEQARAMVRLRSDAFGAIRDVLRGHGYLEVETPILQPVHGGANARPFRTHITAYNLDLYLRIAPELHLKRLLVGGMERVFEIGRNFRNEGADATHNPEFTMLEAYQAYADYDVMADRAQELILAAADAGLGTRILRRQFQGRDVEVDLGSPWRRVRVTEAISEALGEPLDEHTPIDEAARLARGIGIPVDPSWTWGDIVTELYDELCEPTTLEPTFYYDFPAETSPLTRPHRTRPNLAERWDLVAFGMELGTAYSELVDPVLQRDRLTAQSLKAAAGDPEAMQLDEAFLAALEYGMPPAGGLGMGLDRLLMLLGGGNIRTTISFPLVKPR